MIKAWREATIGSPDVPFIPLDRPTYEALFKILCAPQDQVFDLGAATGHSESCFQRWQTKQKL